MNQDKLISIRISKELDKELKKLHKREDRKRKASGLHGRTFSSFIRSILIDAALSSKA